MIEVKLQRNASIFELQKFFTSIGVLTLQNVTVQCSERSKFLNSVISKDCSLPFAQRNIVRQIGSHALVLM